ncbi:hypothetical protein GWI33_022950 [Rhynchophorus ferrugineus]|uniref:Uncharacterized protein n=1 Tax=Rhynchophorus ferrugineus TaxID=354439 RepID=A0A834HLX3_RHYFE|nr:hypothetical protein GWI33_022950 [Rhynchophorus ferrugineus]
MANTNRFTKEPIRTGRISMRKRRVRTWSANRCGQDISAGPRGSARRPHANPKSKTAAAAATLFISLVCCAAAEQWAFFAGRLSGPGGIALRNRGAPTERPKAIDQNYPGIPTIKINDQ